MAVGVAVSSLSSGARLSAQGRPNFSGEWTLVTKVGDQPVGGPLGPRGTISQNDTTLTIARPTGGPLHYRIDGAVSWNPGGGQTGLFSEARWITNSLLITTKPAKTPNPWEDAVLLSLDPRGNLIVVSTQSCTTCVEEMLVTFLVYRRSQG
jgi:hypothetical protein